MPELLEKTGHVELIGRAGPQGRFAPQKVAACHLHVSDTGAATVGTFEHQ